jgi:phosphoribosyl-ATP pyrophosphohydrolase
MAKKASGKKAPAKKPPAKKSAGTKGRKTKAVPAQVSTLEMRPPPPISIGPSAAVLDRLWDVVESRRGADPQLSHSARLLSRGTAKIAQKFGEESVECLIEAVSRNRDALIGESADVLYHLLVMWVDAGIRPVEVWTELQRREGVSGIAEKASRVHKLPMRFGIRSSKIP